MSMALVDTDKLLTPYEAAPIMDMSPRRVQKLCSEGRLGFKVGARYLITTKQAREFKANPPGRPSTK